MLEWTAGSWNNSNRAREQGPFHLQQLNLGGVDSPKLRYWTAMDAVVMPAEPRAVEVPWGLARRVMILID
jgi:hypothetical protein